MNLCGWFVLVNSCGTSYFAGPLKNAVHICSVDCYSASENLKVNLKHASLWNAGSEGCYNWEKPGFLKVSVKT